MKYLCLVYLDEATLDAANDGDVTALRDDLRNGDHYIASEFLQPAEATATVHVTSDGRLSVAAGPYNETKDQPRAFHLIAARDLNEAIRVVSKIPQARTGNIEVRPICEIGHQ